MEFDSDKKKQEQADIERTKQATRDFKKANRNKFVMWDFRLEDKIFKMQDNRYSDAEFWYSVGRLEGIYFTNIPDAGFVKTMRTGLLIATGVLGLLGLIVSFWFFLGTAITLYLLATNLWMYFYKGPNSEYRIVIKSEGEQIESWPTKKEADRQAVQQLYFAMNEIRKEYKNENKYLDFRHLWFDGEFTRNAAITDYKYLIQASKQKS